MTRLAQAFSDAHAQGRAALVGYLTAGDPDLARSEQNIVAACEAGLDVLELGVPFSDPAADGPDVQGAMVRALEAGTTLSAVLEMASRIRAKTATPIVLFSYANPLFTTGPALSQRVSEAGIDALLVVDMPPRHAAMLRDPAQACGLDWVGLVAPTTTAQRLKRIAAVTTGFVYAVTLCGVTGAAVDVQRDSLGAQLRAVRASFDVPVVAGFGIRTAQQVKTLAGLGGAKDKPLVDGIVVGSALIRASQAGELTELVRALHQATHRR